MEKFFGILLAPDEKPISLKLASIIAAVAGRGGRHSRRL